LFEGNALEVDGQLYRYLSKGEHIEDSFCDTYEVTASGVFARYGVTNNNVEGWQWLMYSDQLSAIQQLAEQVSDDEMAAMSMNATLRSFHNRHR
jgi:hypothetical protein